VKIFVLAPKEDWICDRQAQEWNSANPHLCTDNMQGADIIWLLAGWCWNQVPIQILASKKIVLTVHHIVPEKFVEQKISEFLYRDNFVDVYHVPNDTTRDHIRQFTTKKIVVIPFWFDSSTWSPLDKKNSRKSLNLKEEDFIIGSFQRDTEGESGLPKLEKGPDLFCNLIQKIKNEKLIENPRILLGGWRRSYVIDRLKKMNIDYTYFELVPLETIKKMYASCDLYVVSSRYEGGPQAVLEASAMNVPIISRDVGIAKSVLSPSCVMDIPIEFSIPSSESIVKNYNTVLGYEIHNLKKNFIEMFESV
jgi:glycosyltransferase involved in cell wall biosynthesis